VLLSIVPSVSVGLFSLDDYILSDTKTSKSFLGRPSQEHHAAAVHLQVPGDRCPLDCDRDPAGDGRGLPAQPMVHRILFAIPSLSPIMAPFLEDFIRHKNRLEPIDLMMLGRGLNDGVDGILDEDGSPVVPADINRAGMAAPVISRQQLHSGYYNTVVLKLEEL
jgi:hypothetical protein